MTYNKVTPDTTDPLVITKMKYLLIHVLILSSFIGCTSYKPYGKFENPKNLFPIGLNGKWGYVDSLGNIRIETNYDSAELFSHGLAVAKKANKFGYIDVTGKWMIQPRFDKAEAFYYGCAEASLDDQKQFITRKGKVSKTCELWNLETGCLVPSPPIDPQIYSVRKDNKYALTYKNLKDTTEFIYDSVHRFNKDFIVFSKNNKYGFHYVFTNRNKYGNVELRKPIYDKIETIYYLWNNEIENGSIRYATIKLNGLWGILNAYTLEEIISPRYISIHRNVTSQFILVEFEKNCFGYIDYQGNEFFKREYYTK